MKLKNVSKKVKNFKMKDGSWLSLGPGECFDLPVSVLSNEKDVERVLEEPKEPEEPLEPPLKPPKYSKSALKKLDEKEQVELLERYGVDEETINSLNKESKRVNYLLKLQDE